MMWWYPYLTRVSLVCQNTKYEQLQSADKEEVTDNILLIG
jgi:hypothetical protein